MDNNADLQFATELRTIVGRLIKKMRKESPTGQHLSLTERSTLALLFQHKELLPSELATMEMITNQSMSQVLNHLFELDLIVRVPSQTDKRKINISLSEKGEHTLLQYRHERDEWLIKAINKACTTEEKELIKQAIGPLTKLVELK